MRKKFLMVSLCVVVVLLFVGTIVARNRLFNYMKVPAWVKWLCESQESDSYGVKKQNMSTESMGAGAASYYQVLGDAILYMNDMDELVSVQKKGYKSKTLMDYVEMFLVRDGKIYYTSYDDMTYKVLCYDMANNQTSVIEGMQTCEDWFTIEGDKIIYFHLAEKKEEEVPSIRCYDLKTKEDRELYVMQSAEEIYLEDAYLLDNGMIFMLLVHESEETDSVLDDDGLYSTVVYSINDKKGVEKKIESGTYTEYQDAVAIGSNLYLTGLVDEKKRNYEVFRLSVAGDTMALESEKIYSDKNDFSLWIRDGKLYRRMNSSGEHMSGGGRKEDFIEIAID